MNDEELKQKRITQEIEKFQNLCCPFGSLDIKRAIEIFNQAGLRAEDLFEECETFAEETETDFKTLDVCYVAYDYILQMARNKISEVLSYDFCNDCKNREIYTYGNFCCSNYDYSEEAKKELENNLKEATEEQKTELKKDDCFNTFIDEMGIIL